MTSSLSFPATATKSVEFAYPSSESATELGYPSTGCHILVVEGGDHGQIHAEAHPSRADAVAAARSLDLPWSPFFALVHPREAGCL